MLARLPERQRTAVFLRYYADLDYAAIGEALGITTGTVAATLNAAHSGASHPTGGGTNMTDLDRASLDRILPATSGSADWNDVLRRSGAHQRRRRLVVVLATVAIVAVGAASAFGMRAVFLDKGFIGLPPDRSDAEQPGQRRARDLLLGPLGQRNRERR